MTAFSSYSMPLPWHHAIWKACFNAAQSAKLHHALLFQSSFGSGKTEFIKAFAKLLLCENPIETEHVELYRSCNTCSACLYYQAGTHPNYYEITPSLTGANKSFISIDQIRKLTEALQSTAMAHAGHRQTLNYHTVVVIDPVDTLQVNAVHAILKTLEEPTLGVLFILASAKPHQLAPTIKSRCQSITLSESGEKPALEWLKSELLENHIAFDEDLALLSLHMAHGKPLKALSYLKSNEVEVYQSILSALSLLSLNKIYPGEVVQQWASHPIESLLDYLMLAIFQLTQFKLAEEALGANGSYVLKKESIDLSRRATVDFLFQYWDQLNRVRYEVGLYTLNTMLVLEDLAYTFSNSSNFS